jgi:hypothetical protein
MLYVCVRKCNVTGTVENFFGKRTGATTPRSGLAPGPRYRPRRRHPSRFRRSVQGATAARAHVGARGAYCQANASSPARGRAQGRWGRHDEGDDGDLRWHGRGIRTASIVPSSLAVSRPGPSARTLTHAAFRTAAVALAPARLRSPSRGFWRAVRGCMRPSLLREKARVRPAGGGGFG